MVCEQGKILPDSLYGPVLIRYFTGLKNNHAGRNFYEKPIKCPARLTITLIRNIFRFCPGLRIAVIQLTIGTTYPPVTSRSYRSLLYVPDYKQVC
jgi:hypothetical protein